MRHYIFVAIWLVFTPLSAIAQAHCDAVIPLAQIHAALERVAAPGHRHVTADLEIIQRTLLRIDGSSLRYALRGHPLESQANRFDSLLSLGSQATTLQQTNNTAQAVALAATPTARQLLYSIGQALRPYPCRGEPPTEWRGLQQLQGSGVGAPTNIGITQRTAMLTFALTIVFMGLCMFIIRRNIRRLAEKRRREKRYYVRIRTHLSVLKSRKMERSGAAQPIQIVDISCEGAKVLHTLTFEPGDQPNVEVTLEGKPHTASVVWQNNHFAGLKFHKRIGHTTLRRLVRKNRPKPLGSDAREPVPARQ